jgi:hypothetical protein
MKIINYIGDPKNRKRLSLFFYSGLALVVGADFFIPRQGGHFFWEELFGFGAIYGFISCVLIIIVSKALGHMGLMQPEDYYD